MLERGTNMSRQRFTIKTFFESLDVAFSMYSSIPVPHILWNEQNMKYMLGFFPLIGLVQAVFLMLWVFLSQRLEINPVLFAAVATLIPLIVTGGIHMDGFCDTVDALSSHQTREKKLEILKDSNSGAFAVIGCASYLLLTFALWTQPQEENRMITAQIMSIGYVLSRSMSALSVVHFPCAKNSGLAHSFSCAAQKKRVGIIATVFILLCAVCLLCVHLWYGLAVCIACTCVFLFYYRMSMKQFGGITGDLAGYFLQINELTILLMSVCIGIFVK